jgi:hypothetical protein
VVGSVAVGGGSYGGRRLGFGAGGGVGERREGRRRVERKREEEIRAFARLLLD